MIMDDARVGFKVLNYDLAVSSIRRYFNDKIRLVSLIFAKHGMGSKKKQFVRGVTPFPPGASTDEIFPTKLAEIS